MDRARPLRDVVKDLLSYFDGYIRIENGMLRPGMYPHDGQAPGLVASLTDHDFSSRPRSTSTAPSRAINKVVVTYRDGGDMLKKKPANGIASDSLQARQTSEHTRVDMPGIIDAAQAADYAARAAAVAAEGTFEGSVDLRRALRNDGTPLQPGDVVGFSYSPLGINRVVRITGLTTPRRGAVSIDFTGEHGLFADMPPAKPDLRPQLGERLPYAITKARVFELPEGLLANADGPILGIPVTFLAMRPRSYYKDQPDMTGEDVMSFDVWDSPSGATYDPLGESQKGWAVRATLRASVAKGTAAVAVQLALDADNIDRDRIVAQNESAQENDVLLLVVGEEVLSVGSIAVSGNNWTVNCLRARCDSSAAAHAGGAEAWLVYADEISVLTHKQWRPDTDRWFKLQPATISGSLELAEVAALKYRFKPALAAAPVAVVIDAVVATAKVGDMVEVKGTATAPSGNLAGVMVVWIRLGANDAPAGEQTLTTIMCFGAQKSECAVDTLAVPMAAGRYRAEIRATNDAGVVTKAASTVVVVEAVEVVVPESEPIVQAYKAGAQGWNVFRGTTETVLELRVTTTERPVMVFYSLLGKAYNGENPSEWGVVGLFASVQRDGVGVPGSASQFAAGEVNRSDTGHRHLSIGTVTNFFQDMPGAGEHTYAIRVENRAASESGGYATVDQVRIYVLGLPGDVQGGASELEPGGDSEVFPVLDPKNSTRLNMPGNVWSAGVAWSMDFTVVTTLASLEGYKLVLTRYPATSGAATRLDEYEFGAQDGQRCTRVFGPLTFPVGSWRLNVSIRALVGSGAVLETVLYEETGTVFTVS